MAIEPGLAPFEEAGMMLLQDSLESTVDKDCHFEREIDHKRALTCRLLRSIKHSFL